MPSAPWRRLSVPAPAYKDEDGPWWHVEEIAHWWVRPREWIDPDLDGFEARHQHGYLADVTAPSMYLLAIFTWQSQFRYATRQREASAT